MKTELEQAVSLVAGGATYGDAATQLGLTRNQVAGACHRAGFTTGKGRSQGKGRPVPARIAMAQEAVRAHPTLRAAADALGMSASTLKDWRDRYFTVGASS